MCVDNVRLRNNLFFHPKKSGEVWLRFARRHIDELIIVSLRLLQHAFSGLKPIEVDALPFPLVAPPTRFRVEREACDARLVLIRRPIHTVIDTSFESVLRGTFFATFVGARQRPGDGRSLAVLFLRVTGQATHRPHCCPAQDSCASARQNWPKCCRCPFDCWNR